MSLVATVTTVQRVALPHFIAMHHLFFLHSHYSKVVNPNHAPYILFFKLHLLAVVTLDIMPTDLNPESRCQEV